MDIEIESNGRLPEECISDATWQRLLPSDYASYLSQAVDPVKYTSKKELYFRLCDRPVIIDGGLMSFGLDKSSGAKIFMLSARKLGIVWGDDTRYWDWIDHPDSRFKCALLKYVCWLEICGEINSKILTPNTSYAAFLVYKLAENAWGLSYPSQTTKVAFAGIESEHSVRLNYREREEHICRCGRYLPRGDLEGLTDAAVPPQHRQDGWLEVELGEFNSGNGIDGEVNMSLLEIKGGHWKSGLIVQGIEVRPKHSYSWFS